MPSSYESTTISSMLGFDINEEPPLFASAEDVACESKPVPKAAVIPPAKKKPRTAKCTDEEARIGSSSGRTRASCRPAPFQFSDKVVLGEYEDKHGHWDVAAGKFWPDTAAVPLSVSDSEKAKVVVLADDRCTSIPAMALNVFDETRAYVECFDFKPLPSFPSILLVDATQEDVNGLLHGMFEGMTCGPFVENELFSRQGMRVQSVVRFVSSKHCSPAAFRLVANGIPVSLALASSDAPHPVTRFQAHHLKWLKDSDTRMLLARQTECMPGLASTSLPSASTAPPLSGYGVSWFGSLYKSDMDVPRAMMSWSAIASFMVREWLHDDATEEIPFFFDAVGTCEPLASYVSAVLASASTPGSARLKYNVPFKPSTSQVHHALELFYWCALHKDEDTIPCAHGHLLKSLELYLRFGLVVTVKRAYHFHVAKPKTPPAEA
jgi:hypothetical protein